MTQNCRGCQTICEALCQVWQLGDRGAKDNYRQNKDKFYVKYGLDLGKNNSKDYPPRGSGRLETDRTRRANSARYAVAILICSASIGLNYRITEIGCRQHIHCRIGVITNLPLFTVNEDPGTRRKLTDIHVNCRKLHKWIGSKRFDTLTATDLSQCSTTGITKAVVCAILSVGWCI